MRSHKSNIVLGLPYFSGKDITARRIFGDVHSSHYRSVLYNIDRERIQVPPRYPVDDECIADPSRELHNAGIYHLFLAIDSVGHLNP